MKIPFRPTDVSIGQNTKAIKYITTDYSFKFIILSFYADSHTNHHTQKGAYTSF